MDKFAGQSHMARCVAFVMAGYKRWMLTPTLSRRLPLAAGSAASRLRPATDCGCQTVPACMSPCRGTLVDTRVQMSPRIGREAAGETCILPSSLWLR